MVSVSAILGRLWTDRCTLTVREAVTDPKTHITGFVERVQFRDEPCRLSYKAGFRDLPTAEVDALGRAGQTVRLILRQDLEVPPGSKLTVEHAGRTEEYAQSGKSAVHTNHQEISLELFRGWT